MAICKLCLQARPLVNSHIIPEAFFREINGGSGTFLFSAGDYKKRAPIGPYEPMLCQDCEDKFGKADSYGVDVLLKRFSILFNKEVITHDVTVFRSKEDAIDQSLLQRFFISVLWRASVSKHVFYQQVGLGKLERFAMEAVDYETPLSGKFSVVLFHFPDSTEGQTLLGKLIRNPHQDRFDGINGYRFYFGKFGAFIMADTRGFPSKISGITLNHGKTVEIVGGTFMAESDRTAMKNFMTSSIASGKFGFRR